MKKDIYSYIGKHCDAYNDGKYSPSRMVRIEIDSVLSRVDVNKRYWKKWKDAVQEDLKRISQSLDNVYYSRREDVFGDSKEGIRWDWDCKEFIFGHIIGDEESVLAPMMFARTVDGGWYSVNWNYSLDLDSAIRRKRLKYWKECARERGMVMFLNKSTELYDYEVVRR